MHLVLLYRIVDITIVSTNVISTFIRFSNAIGNDIATCFLVLIFSSILHLLFIYFIMFYSTVLYRTATKNTAKISNNLGFFSLLFITNATSIVNTIDTGFVYELSTTELEYK